MDDILGRLEKLGADFASVRYERSKSLSISLMENEVFQVVVNEGQGGHAIKVIMNGGHSHVSTALLTPADLNYAVLINPKRGEERVPETSPARARVRIKLSDGLQKGVEEKVEDVRNLRKVLVKCGRRLKDLSITYEEEIIHKEYSDSLGGSVIQDFPLSMLDISAVAKKADHFATALEHKATNSGYVFDFVDSCELQRGVTSQLDSQLGGSLPKAGEYEVVLAPSSVGILCHEVLGHLSEADIAESGILSALRGKRIAGRSITIMDHPTMPDKLTSGFTPYDDEGTKGRTVKILDRGVVKDLMTDRYYAGMLGEPPTGNARAESYHETPMVRMRNTRMAPGDQSAEELISGVKAGYLIISSPSGTGSPDGSFQFGIQEGYRIERGELREGIAPGVSMAGHVLKTLARINGTSKEAGMASDMCEKGDQGVYVSAGGPYARIGGLKVGGHA
jgi:TldD protein